MSQSPINNSYSVKGGTPLYNYGVAPQAVTTLQGQTVNLNPQNQAQIYKYPTTSLYEPTKQQASGVNIIICNPSGYSNGSSGAVPYYPVMPAPQIINNIPAQPAPVVNNNIPEPVINNDITTPVQASAPIANTPISSKNEQENVKNTKRITVITDDYVKNLESYLRNPSKETRQIAISQLIKLFEEDNSRFDDPALNALINIALQDNEPSNRIMAMLPLTTGAAAGDDNTKLLLEKLAASTQMFGEEAKTAQEALLMVSRNSELVPDDSKK